MMVGEALVMEAKGMASFAGTLAHLVIYHPDLAAPCERWQRAIRHPPLLAGYDRCFSSEPVS